MTTGEALPPRQLAGLAVRLVRLLTDEQFMRAYALSYDLAYSSDAYGSAGKITGGGDRDPTFSIITDKRKDAIRSEIRDTTAHLEEALRQFNRHKRELERHGGLRVAKWDQVEAKAARESRRRDTAFVTKQDQLGDAGRKRSSNGGLDKNDPDYEWKRRNLKHERKKAEAEREELLVAAGLKQLPNGLVAPRDAPS